MRTYTHGTTHITHTHTHTQKRARSLARVVAKEGQAVYCHDDSHVTHVILQIIFQLLLLVDVCHIVSNAAHVTVVENRHLCGVSFEAT